MKLSRSQLRDIKKSFKKKNNEDRVDEDETEQSKSRHDVKKIFKKEKKDNEKNQNTNEKKRLKKAKKEKNVSIEWNIEVGDAVEFKTSNRDDSFEFGIVLKLTKDENYQNLKQAMNNCCALILAHSGNFWVNLRNILKLEDED